MNVASLELCRELYELSGWTGTHTVWHDDTTISPFACGYEDINAAIHFIPAYDLGYLLRKLPADAKVWKKRPQRQSLYQAEIHHPLPVGTADTPEDAAAKLAIELFKQGILTREK